MDGTEFRFVKEITKNWNRTYKFRDFSRTKVPPYTLIVNDLLNKTSDLGMCSIWVLVKNYKRLDRTTFFEQHCLTILVPKPKKLNEATAIYRALGPITRHLLFICFCVSSILLNFFSKMEKRLYQRNSQYTEFSRAVLETINTATSHPVHRFPRGDGQAPVKILLSRWDILSKAENFYVKFFTLVQIFSVKLCCESPMSSRFFCINVFSWDHCTWFQLELHLKYFLNTYIFYDLSIFSRIISWIWLFVWMSIIYSTTYTSRLTSPGYEIPINSVKQFLDNSTFSITTRL